jgi:hypothetical protein
MDFLKKHYEKVTLGAILLGLAIAAVAVFMSASDAQSTSATEPAGPPPKTPYQPLNLTTQEMAVARLKTPPKVKLVGTNLTFNPVLWVSSPKGQLRKITPGERGPEALKLSKPTPIPFSIEFIRVAAGSYQFTITTNLGPNLKPEKADRYPRNIGEKAPGSFFVLREIRGDRENPDSFLLELNDTKELVTVAKGRPYIRVKEYSVDLRYEPENKTFRDQRENGILLFENDAYKIVAINSAFIRFQSLLTGRQTTLQFPPSSLLP